MDGAGESCGFSIVRHVDGDFSGPDHNNVFTATAEDNDLTPATDTDDATVDFSDVAPAIEVTKTADPTSVPETGGNVTFAFTVENTSTEEAVTITGLGDSDFGILTGDDDCKLGTVLAAYSFHCWSAPPVLCHWMAAAPSAAKPGKPSKPAGLPADIDPVSHVLPEHMTWDDYKPVPGYDWNDPSYQPPRKIRAALVLGDFEDHPFIVEQKGLTKDPGDFYKRHLITEPSETLNATISAASSRFASRW